MDMPTSLSDFVISRHDEQMPLLEAYVEGKFDFPSTHCNTLLLHGSYGSGKTLLGNVLPILIEYGRADSETRLEFNFCYRVKDKEISITPNNCGKKKLFAQIDLITCGGESSTEKQKKVKQIDNSQFNCFDWAANSYQYFIFDEVDEWNSTQSDLKSLISNAPSTSIFILTTNYLHKLDKGLLSRSADFEMNKIESVRLLPIIRGYYPFTADISDEKLERVVSEGNGDWRAIKRLIEDVKFTHQLRVDV